ncbi:MAG: arginase [Crocinitomicaceae bacterium]|nr:arginase [Crocinitomicaceae bacterium]
MNNHIVLIENMSEITAGTRGASLGMGALKVAARNAHNEYFGNFETKIIQNENHLLDREVQFEYAKRIDGLEKIYQRMSSTVSEVLESGKFPICISGDHGSAGGTIAGIKKNFPNKRLGVIWIDAHADLHTPYTTPSGNIHGMPLSTALNEDNLESQINDPSEKTKEFWESLQNLENIAPKIQAEDLIFIGVRDTETPEDELIARKGIKNFTVEEVRDKGTSLVVDEVLTQLSDCDIIYVSFDVDSMDCDLVSYGTGTPVKNGLTQEEADYFVRRFSEEEKTVCLEVVEINPCLDNKVNTMAETAFKILDNATTAIQNKLNQ